MTGCVSLFPKSEITAATTLAIDSWLESVAKEREFGGRRERVHIAQGDRFFALQDASQFGGGKDEKAELVVYTSYELGSPEFKRLLLSKVPELTENHYNAAASDASAVVFLNLALALARRIDAAWMLWYEFGPPECLLQEKACSVEKMRAFAARLPGCAVEVEYTHEIPVASWIPFRRLLPIPEPKAEMATEYYYLLDRTAVEGWADICRKSHEKT